jgi:ATP-dependent Clp protease ATP-binding subunit ClpA
LSEIFFGPEAVMLRLDMSEYSSFDSLARLIGRYDNETPGVLSSMIREHQYGVLLLDEFEKTSGQVLDLFLQILDEGMFSDALGHKVNARNLIIVATSNAGSGYIFDVIKSGANLLSKRDEITEHIIADGTFKPELLNRFDGVILFHPLGDEHLKGVAKVMLARLSWRLKDKGMTLVVNDALINFLVSQGRDQKFGARPLNRVIQDKIEKIIADRMISGQYKVGSTIEFSATDFQNTVA